MNKKFFAALSSAAILLSSSAPLIALANDDQEPMVEVDLEAGGPAGIGQDTSTGKVAINAKNFPDENLRKGLYNIANLYYGQVDDDGNPATATIDDKNYTTPTTADQITTIVIGPDVKDLSGIQYCTNATVVVLGASQMRNSESYSASNTAGGGIKGIAWDNSANKEPAEGSADEPEQATNQQEVNPKEKLNYVYEANNNISSLDLSALTKLEALFIGGYKREWKTEAITVMDSSAGDPVGNNALFSVTIPETDTLTDIVLLNNKSLPTLDLSGASDVVSIIAKNNNLASITLPTAKTLKYLNLEQNSLGSLDLSNLKNLAYLYVSTNNIYELTVPTSLITLEAEANILKEFDASELENLEELMLGHNMLQSLELPEVNKLTTLSVNDNHLASLNNIESAMITTEPAGVFDLVKQTIYVNEEAEAINLLDYDSNFEYRNALPKGIVEKDNILPLVNGTATYTYNLSYTYSTYYPDMDVTVIEADLMNRLYNPNSGEHFYTKDLNEKDVLVKLGWQPEGIGWVAPMASESNIPVYRLYNPNAGDHHYTKDPNERDTLVRVGWNYEGIGWYSAQEARPDEGLTSTTQVYREYNPNAKAAGAHNYTINPVENDALISIGWIDEGIAWWALK